jgi:hypothetical protein
MTKAQFAPPSIEIPARSAASVSGSAVVGWLVVFTLLGWACAKLEPLGPSVSLVGTAIAISALECCETVFARQNVQLESLANCRRRHRGDGDKVLAHAMATRLIHALRQQWRRGNLDGEGK